jgi:hypothetical protein
LSVLLIVMGPVSLQVLKGVNDQTNELIRQERKIVAYRQVQHDTTNQLYGISTALLLRLDTAPTHSVRLRSRPHGVRRADRS